MDNNRSSGFVRRGVSLNPRRPLPLAVWMAIGITATTVTTLISVLLVLRPAWEARTFAAVGVAVVVGASAAAISARFAQAVGESIREFARRATHDDTVSTDSVRVASADWMSELADLRRVVDALQLRARVAEDVSGEARRTAEMASAGMFDLLSGLVAAEEATRGQLSAELHDTVAQTLASARQLLDAPEGQPGRWERLRELVEDAEEQLRATMARARPPEMRDGDLAAAVAGLRSEFRARYLFDVQVSWPDEPHPLPLVSAVTVYRFFQEGLLNVVKHADVDEAEASLNIEVDKLVATVRDEGPGFDPDGVKPAGGRHVGLGLLRERARLAGGRVDIDSHAGEGTTLRLHLPVRLDAELDSSREDEVFTNSMRLRGRPSAAAHGPADSPN